MNKICKRCLVSHDENYLYKKRNICKFCINNDRKKRKLDGHIGERFHNLIVEGYINNNKFCITSWLNCRCDCGKYVVLAFYEWSVGRRRACPQCTVRKKSIDKVGMIDKSWWTSMVAGAKTREISLSITIFQAWDKFLSQNGLCAITGLSLYFPSYPRGTDGTASLDRIESSLGYDDYNIQWVHKDINRMKSYFTDEYFVNMCQQAVSYSNFKYSEKEDMQACSDLDTFYVSPYRYTKQLVDDL